MADNLSDFNVLCLTHKNSETLVKFQRIDAPWLASYRCRSKTHDELCVCVKSNRSKRCPVLDFEIIASPGPRVPLRVALPLRRRGDCPSLEPALLLPHCQIQRLDALPQLGRFAATVRIA